MVEAVDGFSPSNTSREMIQKTTLTRELAPKNRIKADTSTPIMPCKPSWEPMNWAKFPVSRIAQA